MAGISINLAGNFGKLDELKDKAHKTANSIKSAFGSDLGKKMFAGVAVAATAAFAGVAASVKKAIDAGGELNDMMLRTGAAGKGLVILQQMFANAGLAGSKVPEVLNKMQKALSGVNDEGEPTNEAFGKLGLSIEKLTAMDPAEALAEVGKAIASLDDPAKRDGIAMELFGRSGGELLAVFKDAGAFDSAKQQVGGLADLLPSIAAELDTVGDALGTFDSKINQLGAGVASALLPQLLELAEWMNTADFIQTGRDIGVMAEAVLDLGTYLGDVVKSIPGMQKLVSLIDQAGSKDPEAGTALPAPPIMIDANGKAVSTAEDAPSDAQAEKDPFAQPTSKKEREKADKEWETLEKKREAARKKLEAAESELDIEMQILAARLKGDDARLTNLQREKAIREEIARLEGAGFTTADATVRATTKVDAETKATSAEDMRTKMAEGRNIVSDILAGKLADVRGRQKSQQYESTIGAVGSMQRIGGGGGAVSSGLDYARQAADLQREANMILRAIAAHTTPPADN